MRPAIGDEFRNPDGAGPSQQLWRHGDGRLCRGGEDRFICLHAGAGFWQCFFHLHCPELWGGQPRADPKGDAQRCTHLVFLLCRYQRTGVCVRTAADGDFVQAEETGVIGVGVEYLRIEGAFYFGIGLLFLLYGYYRAVAKPGMSVVLTVFSLGTRVLLAYVLSAVDAIGVTGIWVSVPIGWALADIVGVGWYFISKRREDRKRIEE